MTQSKLSGFSHEKAWWIFPVRYVNVYQAGQTSIFLWVSLGFPIFPGVLSTWVPSSPIIPHPHQRWALAPNRWRGNRHGWKHGRCSLAAMDIPGCTVVMRILSVLLLLLLLSILYYIISYHIILYCIIL